LAPLLKRMVVALGTMKARAKEQLRCVFQLRGRIADLPIPRHRRVFVDFTRGGDNLARKPVERFVFKKAVANPLVKRVGAPGLATVSPLVPQQGAPLIGKEIRV